MATYNSITLLGNVAAEPRSSISGKCTDVYLAVNGTKKDEPPLFINVRTFTSTAEFVQKYVRKGASILVEGKLVMETYTDKSGKERKSYSVNAFALQLLGGANRQQQRPQQEQSFQQSSYADEDISF